MKFAYFEPYPRIAPSNLGNEFQGKSVLITGGNGGIGAAIAKSFAAAGAASIILVARNQAKLSNTAKELETYEPATTVVTRSVDIASKESIDALFKSLDASPDYLINNAGHLPVVQYFLESDLDDWWSGFQVNILGTAMMTKMYLQHRSAHISDSASAAVVININSKGSYGMSFPGFSSYAPSKSALGRWNEIIASEVPDTRARFISVHPGVVETEMFISSGLVGKVPEDYTNVKLTADFTLWACSNEAAFLNGRFLHVNWDVDELVQRKDEILEKKLLVSSLSGE